MPWPVASQPCYRSAVIPSSNLCIVFLTRSVSPGYSFGEVMFLVYGVYIAKCAIVRPLGVQQIGLTSQRLERTVGNKFKNVGIAIFQIQDRLN